MVWATESARGLAEARPAFRFEKLYEDAELPHLDLPDALESIYGSFGIAERTVFANFVSSLDGAVALPNVDKSSSVISGGHPADRFLVALLRAVADAVVIGAGTYRQHSGPWTADKAYPDAGESWAELRKRLDAPPEPTFVVVTRSGSLGPPRTYLRGSLIVTTESVHRLDPYREA